MSGFGGRNSDNPVPQPPEAQQQEVRARGRILHLTAAVLGAFAAVYVAFMMPLPVIIDGNTVISTLAAVSGFGAVAISFLPTLLAIMPLAISAEGRQSIAVANAGVVTVLAVLVGLELGLFYAPAALMMWLAVIVPWRYRRGIASAQYIQWRVFGAIVVALPAALILTSLASGTFETNVQSVLIGVGLAVLGVLFGFGSRVTYYLVVLVGLAALVLTMLYPGMIAAAVWWIGGLYIAVGMTAISAQPHLSRR